MKKLLLSIIIAILAFASSTEVTTIGKKTTKDSIIFTYDVPDKNFNALKSKPEFFKNLLITMVCKNKNAKLLSDSMNIVYDYRKHSNNNDKIVIKIKKGICNTLK